MMFKNTLKSFISIYMNLSRLLSLLGLKALTLSPISRRSFLVLADLLFVALSIWLSFWLRLAHPWPSQLHASLWLFPVSLIVASLVYTSTGQYTALTRYVGSVSLYRLAGRNGLIVLIILTAGVLFNLPLPPRSSWLLLWLLLAGFTGSARFLLRDVLIRLQDNLDSQYVRVAIYGAGSAGAQLAAALRLHGHHKVLVFVDDEQSLWQRSINGIPITSPRFLTDNPHLIDQVLLAIPSLSRHNLRRIVESLQPSNLPVLQVPTLDEITSGQARIDSLRPIAIEELLGRDSVPPINSLLGPGIQDRVVLVTGAGGSIGSELCRQILQLRPARLVLLEISEPSLYAIEQELKSLLFPECDLIAVLGSATNYPLVLNCLISHQVDTVFHAAAYKHVPLVESNPLSGLANNVLSTYTLCRTALATSVSQFILISTDKAVRPTNVMGASKRLSELIVQAFAAEVSTTSTPLSEAATRFAMVRFGNVLGSSGSVVPLFRRQISLGGPITLTHPEIIRYFMTITEASQLVLQASTLAQGGDVFLLDMGQPVQILTLAEEMIRLSGLSVRDSSHPNGDIEIVFTGLRPGEKLYEELLIDAQSVPTAHPLIYRALEASIAPDILFPRISELQQSIESHDVPRSIELLASLVPEWSRSSELTFT